MTRTRISSPLDIENRPSVVLLSSSAGTCFGGSESDTLNTALVMSRDFDVRLITGRGNLTDDFRALAGTHKIDYKCLPWMSRDSFFSTHLVKGFLRQKINEFDFEALSLFFSVGEINDFLSTARILEINYPTESLLFPFLKKDVTKVMHFHGPWFPTLYNHLKGPINRHVDALITCCEWSKRQIEKQLDGQRKVSVIYNGVNSDYFSPQATAPFVPDVDYNPDLVRIGTVGRLSRAKGTDLLFNVAQGLAGSAEFFAVGPREQGLFRRQPSLPNFHMLGPVPNIQLPGFYNFVDCFVLPSLFETFPITLLEAMSCGDAVIASAVGGIPELIENNEDGILVPPGDVDALSDALRRVILDRDLRIGLGRAAREKILKHFSLDITYPRIKQIYLELLS